MVFLSFATKSDRLNRIGDAMEETNGRPSNEQAAHQYRLHQAEMLLQWMKIFNDLLEKDGVEISVTRKNGQRDVIWSSGDLAFTGEAAKVLVVKASSGALENHQLDTANETAWLEAIAVLVQMEGVEVSLGEVIWRSGDPFFTTEALALLSHRINQLT